MAWGWTRPRERCRDASRETAAVALRARYRPAGTPSPRRPRVDRADDRKAHDRHNAGHRQGPLPVLRLSSAGSRGAETEEKPDGTVPFLKKTFEGWSPDIHAILTRREDEIEQRDPLRSASFIPKAVVRRAGGIAR